MPADWDLNMPIARVIFSLALSVVVAAVPAAAQKAKRLLSEPAVAGPTDTEGTIALGGGVPIRAGNEVIGAISVSGSPGGEKEEACANAGIQKLADKLK